MPKENPYPTMDPNLLPSSPEYAKQRMNLYERQTQPGFTQGQRALRSYIRSSRGLGDSGIEGALVGESFQRRGDELGNQASQIGLEVAGTNEQNRRRAEGRQWQLDDYNRALEEQKRQEGLAADQRSQQLTGDILQSAGTLVGSYYGGPAGGAAAGGAIGAARGDTSPKPRSNPYRRTTQAEQGKQGPENPYQSDDYYNYEASQVPY